MVKSVERVKERQSWSLWWYGTLEPPWGVITIVSGAHWLCNSIDLSWCGTTRVRTRKVCCMLKNTAMKGRKCLLTSILEADIRRWRGKNFKKMSTNTIQVVEKRSVFFYILQHWFEYNLLLLFATFSILPQTLFVQCS